MITNKRQLVQCIAPALSTLEYTDLMGGFLISYIASALKKIRSMVEVLCSHKTTKWDITSFCSLKYGLIVHLQPR
jgi:hypothetical protein